MSAVIVAQKGRLLRSSVPFVNGEGKFGKAREPAPSELGSTLLFEHVYFTSYCDIRLAYFFGNLPLPSINDG